MTGSPASSHGQQLLALPLWACAVGIFASNLIWSVFQERLGSSFYVSSDGNKERFRATIMLNLCQAAAAALVAELMSALLRLYSNKQQKASGPVHEAPCPGMRTFFLVSAVHSLASPIGYAALGFLPYPLLVLCSSTKLVPIMLVGLIVKRQGYKKLEVACAAIMTLGVLLYARAQAAASGGHHGHAAADAAAVQSITIPVPSALGGPIQLSLSPTAGLIVGLCLIAANLSLEGVTNALQDVLYSRPGVAPLAMMSAMNRWSVLLLGGFLAAEAGAKALGNADGAQASLVAYTFAFAQRHPSVIGHLLGFAVCGAVAQIFIFSCISTHGSFANTTVTVARKFVSVLLSVALFGHHLSARQWAGVAAVFAGLGIQLVDKHNHSTAKAKAAAAAAADAGAGAHSAVAASPVKPASLPSPASPGLPLQALLRTAILDAQEAGGPGTPDELGSAYARDVESDAHTHVDAGGAADSEGDVPVSATGISVASVGAKADERDLRRRPRGRGNQA